MGSGDGHRLGVDFGTTNTVAALAWPDGTVRPLVFDGSPTLPSAVYVSPEGELLVGRDALHGGRVRPEGLEPNPKRCVDDQVVLLAGAEVPVRRLVAAVLRRVAVEAARVAGTAPVHTTLTCPVTWGPRRRQLLRDAAADAGLGPVRLVVEPVAAAAWLTGTAGMNVPVGSCVVVYDFGAGTFDATAVRRDADGFTVLADEGLRETGGLDVDAAVVAYLAASDVSASAEERTAWGRLSAPQTQPDRRARQALWDDVRAAKEALSRASSIEVHVPLVDDVVVVGREQLEQLARPLVERTVATTAGVIRAAGLTTGDVHALFLVGGSSRLPLAATMLHQRLHIAPTVFEQPELVVAQGSLYVPLTDEHRSGISEMSGMRGGVDRLEDREAFTATGSPVTGAAEPDNATAPDPSWPEPPAPAAAPTADVDSATSCAAAGPAGTPLPTQRTPARPTAGRPSSDQPTSDQPFPSLPISGPPYEGGLYQSQPHQSQPHQGQPHQGQPHQGQPHEGRPSMAQPQQGLPYEGRSYQDRPLQEQPHQNQPHAGRSSEGQPYRGRASQEQPVSAQPFAEQPVSVQPFADRPVSVPPQSPIRPVAAPSAQLTGTHPAAAARPAPGRRRSARRRVVLTGLALVLLLAAGGYVVTRLSQRAGGAATTGNAGCAPVRGDGVVALSDEKHTQRAENVVPVMRAAFAGDPDVVSQINLVGAALDTGRLAALNRAVVRDKLTPAAAAEQFAAAGKLNTPVQRKNTYPVQVGASATTEQQVLAQLLRVTLEAAGYRVTVHVGGDRASQLADLQQRRLDVVADYAGGYAAFLNDRVKGEYNRFGTIDFNMSTLNYLGPKEGLAFGTPSAAADQDVFAVSEAFAAGHHVRSLDELAAACSGAATVFGATDDCRQREQCLHALQEVYRWKDATFRALPDRGPAAAAALREGTASVVLISATDPVFS